MCDEIGLSANLSEISHPHTPSLAARTFFEKRTMKSVWPREEDGFITVGRTVRCASPRQRSASAVA